MPADPLDKQLVEAVLSRPRRAKADLEEAKLAGRSIGAVKTPECLPGPAWPCTPEPSQGGTHARRSAR